VFIVILLIFVLFYLSFIYSLLLFFSFFLQSSKTFEVIDCIKCGHCIGHQIRPALSEEEASIILSMYQSRTRTETQEGQVSGLIGVKGEINAVRRRQLACHHTGTHLVHAYEGEGRAEGSEG
jgi:hypothetical protein